jgi:carbon storage regulator
MLVIRRRVGESLQIGEEITVEVLEITPTRVKIGVAAPRSIAVLRGETRLCEEENRRAAEFPPLDTASQWVKQLSQSGGGIPGWPTPAKQKTS